MDPTRAGAPETSEEPARLIGLDFMPFRAHNEGVNDKSYEFYVTHDLGEYSGKWVAIVDEAVVASGNNARMVLEEAARQCPGRQAALAKVPTGEVLIL